MLKFFKRAFIFVSVIFFLLSMAGLALSAIDRSKKNETYKELELFAGALTCVQSQYVDEVKPQDLIYGAIAGMINELDPHSQFLTPQEYEDLKIETEGRFGGIGVEIIMKDGLATIVTPIEDTPAWDAGLKTGDRLVKIDDAVIKNLVLSDVVKKLRGKPGTEVVVIAWREKEDKLYTFKIKRAMIEVNDIKEAKLLEPGIGYIRLAEFREDTPQELDRILKEFKDQGAGALVFDLRNNPGGLLDKAVDVAARFLEKGTLIVSIRGRDPGQDEIFNASYGMPDTSMLIVLLVNEGSASGSEIVAGAFQDNKRAIVLGEKTFGKGSVQTVLPLGDGSALKLTTSRYFTPGGKSIHEKGILPDIVVEQPDAQDRAVIQNKDENGLEMVFETIEEKKTSETVPELKQVYSDDAQLARAVDLLKSIRIYKGLNKLNK